MATVSSDTTRQTREAMNRVAEDASAKVSDAMGQAGEQASAALDRASDAATEGLDRFERMVRRNPLAATAVAAGVGFFLAVLARR